MIQIIYRFLSSVKLALVLLITILVCCFVGVTVLRGERSWELIFNTFWFNGLLALLVLNVAVCFFSRIWRRKITLISIGMILFHLSFVFMLLGIVYNNFYYFKGEIRLTEGETLPNRDIRSYDKTEAGLFFDENKLRGETTLVKMHTGYEVEGDDKRAAYEISVGEGVLKEQGIIYITKHLDYRGFRYFNDVEGYSVLVILYDDRGREIYGAFVPLQSFEQKWDKTYLYSTGTKEGPGTIAFPQESQGPLFGLELVYIPSEEKERSGDVIFRTWPPLPKMPDSNRLPGAAHQEAYEEQGPDPHGSEGGTNGKDYHGGAGLNEIGEEIEPLAEGKGPVSQKIRLGKYYLEAREIRYWVRMKIIYTPGQPIVLTFLWVGLTGMIITFFGRLRRSYR